MPVPHRIRVGSEVNVILMVKASGIIFPELAAPPTQWNNLK
jgi:hypothetical protein